MSRSRVFSVVLVLGLVALGFEAGRRYPYTFLTSFLRPPRDPVWRVIAPSPIPRFEAAVATVAGKVYVFGGFHTREVQASPRVDVYDLATGSWSRKHDMPKAFTHANAALVGETVWFAGGFVGDSPGPATAEVWKYDPAADRWSSGPPLPAPRGSGALALLDGSLHYFGGFLEDRNTGSSDHWVLPLADTARGSSWTRAAPLPTPRGHLSGVGLDGMLYAIGGCRDHDPYPVDLALVHRYDPATDTWSEMASLPFPLSHAEAGTFLRHGRIVVTGGRSRPTRLDASRSVFEYDPALDQWTALPPLPEARFAVFAQPVGDGMIAGTGGVGRRDPRKGPVWEGHWDGRWVVGDSLPVALGEVSGGIIGDRLYLVGQGGEATLALDLRTGWWDEPGRRAARIAPGHHHAALVWGAKLYLLGGFGYESEGAVQVYDPAADGWSMGPAMPFKAGASASAVIDGMIYVAGGIVGDSTTALGARLDPSSGVWTMIAPMPRPRNHAAAATDGRRLFVFGGRGPGSGDSNVVANGFDDVQIYDPAGNTWTVSGTTKDAPAPLPQARGGAGKAVFVEGEFWVIGGETLDGPGATKRRVYSRVDIYDPRTNRWRSGPPLPIARHGIFPLFRSGRIYVAGGGPASGKSRSSHLDIFYVRGGTPLPSAAP